MNEKPAGRPERLTMDDEHTWTRAEIEKAREVKR